MLSENSSLLSEGEAFFIEVMTKDKNGNDRKLCELAVTKEELLDALSKVEPKEG